MLRLHTLPGYRCGSRTWLTRGSAYIACGYAVTAVTHLHVAVITFAVVACGSPAVWFCGCWVYRFARGYAHAPPRGSAVGCGCHLVTPHRLLVHCLRLGSLHWFWTTLRTPHYAPAVYTTVPVTVAVTVHTWVCPVPLRSHYARGSPTALPPHYLHTTWLVLATTVHGSDYVAHSYHGYRAVHAPHAHTRYTPAVAGSCGLPAVPQFTFRFTYRLRHTVLLLPGSAPLPRFRFTACITTLPPLLVLTVAGSLYVPYHRFYTRLVVRTGYAHMVHITVHARLLVTPYVYVLPVAVTRFATWFTGYARSLWVTPVTTLHTAYTRFTGYLVHGLRGCYALLVRCCWMQLDADSAFRSRCCATPVTRFGSRFTPLQLRLHYTFPTPSRVLLVYTITLPLHTFGSTPVYRCSCWLVPGLHVYAVVHLLPLHHRYGLPTVTHTRLPYAFPVTITPPHTCVTRLRGYCGYYVRYRALPLVRVTRGCRYNTRRAVAVTTVRWLFYTTHLTLVTTGWLRVLPRSVITVAGSQLLVRLHVYCHHLPFPRLRSHTLHVCSSHLPAVVHCLCYVLPGLVYVTCGFTTTWILRFYHWFGYLVGRCVTHTTLPLLGYVTHIRLYTLVLHVAAHTGYGCYVLVLTHRIRFVILVTAVLVLTFAALVAVLTFCPVAFTVVPFFACVHTTPHTCCSYTVRTRLRCRLQFCSCLHGYGSTRYYTTTTFTLRARLRPTLVLHYALRFPAYRTPTVTHATTRVTVCYTHVAFLVVHSLTHTRWFIWMRCISLCRSAFCSCYAHARTVHGSVRAHRAHTVHAAGYARYTRYLPPTRFAVAFGSRSSFFVYRLHTIHVAVPLPGSALPTPRCYRLHTAVACRSRVLCTHTAVVTVAAFVYTHHATHIHTHRTLPRLPVTVCGSVTFTRLRTIPLRGCGYGWVHTPPFLRTGYLPTFAVGSAHYPFGSRAQLPDTVRTLCLRRTPLPTAGSQFAPLRCYTRGYLHILPARLPHTFIYRLRGWLPAPVAAVLYTAVTGSHVGFTPRLRSRTVAFCAAVCVYRVTLPLRGCCYHTWLLPSFRSFAWLRYTHCRLYIYVHGCCWVTYTVDLRFAVICRFAHTTLYPGFCLCRILRLLLLHAALPLCTTLPGYWFTVTVATTVVLPAVDSATYLCLQFPLRFCSTPRFCTVLRLLPFCTFYAVRRLRLYTAYTRLRGCRCGSLHLYCVCGYTFGLVYGSRSSAGSFTFGCICAYTARLHGLRSFACSSLRLRAFAYLLPPPHTLRHGLHGSPPALRVLHLHVCGCRGCRCVYLRIPVARCGLHVRGSRLRYVLLHTTFRGSPRLRCLPTHYRATACSYAVPPAVALPRCYLRLPHTTHRMRLFAGSQFARLLPTARSRTFCVYRTRGCTTHMPTFTPRTGCLRLHYALLVTPALPTVLRLRSSRSYVRCTVLPLARLRLGSIHRTHTTHICLRLLDYTRSRFTPCRAVPCGYATPFTTRYGYAIGFCPSAVTTTHAHVTVLLPPVYVYLLPLPLRCGSLLPHGCRVLVGSVRCTLYVAPPVCCRTHRFAHAFTVTVPRAFTVTTHCWLLPHRLHAYVTHTYTRLRSAAVLGFARGYHYRALLRVYRYAFTAGSTLAAYIFTGTFYHACQYHWFTCRLVTHRGWFAHGSRAFAFCGCLRTRSYRLRLVAVHGWVTLRLRISFGYTRLYVTPTVTTAPVTPVLVLPRLVTFCDSTRFYLRGSACTVATVAHPHRFTYVLVVYAVTVTYTHVAQPHATQPRTFAACPGSPAVRLRFSSRARARYSLTHATAPRCRYRTVTGWFADWLLYVLVYGSTDSLHGCYLTGCTVLGYAHAFFGYTLRCTRFCGYRFCLFYGSHRGCAHARVRLRARCGCSRYTGSHLCIAMPVWVHVLSTYTILRLLPHALPFATLPPDIHTLRTLPFTHHTLRFCYARTCPVLPAHLHAVGLLVTRCVPRITPHGCLRSRLPVVTYPVLHHVCYTPRTVRSGYPHACRYLRSALPVGSAAWFPHHAGYALQLPTHHYRSRTVLRFTRLRFTAFAVVLRLLRLHARSRFAAHSLRLHFTFYRTFCVTLPAGYVRAVAVCYGSAHRTAVVAAGCRCGCRILPCAFTPHMVTTVCARYLRHLRFIYVCTLRTVAGSVLPHTPFTRYVLRLRFTPHTCGLLVYHTPFAVRSRGLRLPRFGYALLLRHGILRLLLPRCQHRLPRARLRSRCGCVYVPVLVAVRAAAVVAHAVGFWLHTVRRRTARAMPAVLAACSSAYGYYCAAHTHSWFAVLHTRALLPSPPPAWFTRFTIRGYAHTLPARLLRLHAPFYTHHCLTPTRMRLRFISLRTLRLLRTRVAVTRFTRLFT